MTVTAIVLAGGRSTRFGADKLAAPLGQATVLGATIDSLAGVVDGVIVAGPSLPEGFASDTPVALVRDRTPFDGPLVALVNVLEPAQPDPPDVAIVVGGDMPRLVPRVLVAMLDALDADPSIEAVLLGRAAAGAQSPRQVLPLAVRVWSARRAALLAVDEGHRSLQSFVDRLTFVELDPALWLPLDPDAATLTDIDTRADLDRLNGP